MILVELKIWEPSQAWRELIMADKKKRGLVQAPLFRIDPLITG